MSTKLTSSQSSCSEEDALAAHLIWHPDTETIARSNIAIALRDLGMSDYQQFYDWSVSEPEAFWGYVVRLLDIRFIEPPQRTLDLSHGATSPIWLPGARLNIVETCFQADAEAPAIVSGDPNGSLQTTSYGQVLQLAEQIAYSLRRIGLEAGDPVGVFMPMSAVSVPIYLGIVLAGCVVVSIADSFSSEQVALRLRISESRALFTVSQIQRGKKLLPVYGRAVEAGAPLTIVVDAESQRRENLRSSDLSWEEFLGEEGRAKEIYASPQTPINILFSSGTTGEPKAIPWDHTTPIKAASDGYFHHDIHPGDVVAWPTNLGWMMGPWLIFATMINRGTVALFDGSPMDQSFGRFVQDVRVNMLGVVPGLVRHWRQTHCMDQLDWSAIKAFSSTGECSNPDDMRFLSDLGGGKPIIEYCGGTEIGGGYVASTVVQPNVASAFSTPALGSAVVILDKGGKPAPTGELFLIPPAMGLSERLVCGDHHEVYFAGTPSGPSGQTLRRHGDQFEQLPNGYLRALGRADDSMNIGGIKVGAAEIERVLSGIGGIREVAAIAVRSLDGGPNQLVICAAGVAGCEVDSGRLLDEMRRAVKVKLNPLFKIRDLLLLDKLPRTASNKIIRRQLRKDFECHRRKACSEEPGNPRAGRH